MFLGLSRGLTLVTGIVALTATWLFGTAASAQTAPVPSRWQRQLWTGMGGARVSVFTSSPRFYQAPNSTALVGSSYAWLGDNYAARTRGYITPTTTGLYTFWVAGDDEAQWFMAPNASKWDAKKLSGTTSLTDWNSWDDNLSQRTEPQLLLAGQSYYVELLHKNSADTNHASVAWAMQAVEIGNVQNWATTAMGAVATQSTTFVGPNTSFPASGAIDGNVNTYSLTANTAGSWIQVDFRQDRLISSVELTNRLATQQDRLSNFRLSIVDAVGKVVAFQDYYPLSGSIAAAETWTLPQTVTGRRVRIQLLGPNRQNNHFLNLAEIKALGPDITLRNWAKQPAVVATQSSSFSSSFPASAVIDGNVATYNLTANTPGSSLQVDLGADRLIDTVELINRLDGQQDRLSNFRVSLLDATDAVVSSQDYFLTTGNARGALRWELPQAVTGRKLKVELLGLNRQGNHFFNLAEVNVWGRSNPANSARGLREPIPAAVMSSYVPALTDDRDDDGMTHAFETAHGLNPDDRSDALLDPDLDGFTNVEEFQLGTNPALRGGVPGTLQLETWNGLVGSAIEDLTMNPRFVATPSMTEFVFSAQTPSNRADNFGSRMRGYIIAPATGTYTFYVAGGDRCQLFLSSSQSQFAKAQVASSIGATSIQEWTKFPSQQSTEIALVAGQKYYIEALQKEAVSTDHLEIGWKTPGATTIAVIPGTALESYAYDIEDSDGDNMPATWETANGLNPATNDAALDPDQDGINHLIEFTSGTSPTTKNTLAGALLHELWWNVPGYKIRSFATSPRLLAVPDQRYLIPRAQGPSDIGDNYANILRGYLTAPVTGTYTFWAAGNEELEFWLSTSASKFDKKLLIVPTLPSPNFTADISMKSRAVQLSAGQQYYMEIRHSDDHGTDHCAVAWTPPNGTLEIIPGSVLSSYLPTSDDLDDDDIPDAYELANGLSITDNGHLNPTNGAAGDLDGDGLTNAEEWKAGTRADLADSDSDGVNDRDEVEMMETQALMADAAPFESVTTLAGAAYTASSGAWVQQGSKAKQDCVRGWLEYPVTLTTAGVYQLDLSFTPVTDTGVSPDYEIVFSIDGTTIQREIVTVAQATSGHAKILSPWLSAGGHTLRVFVDNSYHFRRVTVDQLEILAARGPDANSNGTPDWVDLRLAKYNSIEAPAESLTSPVCLEGKARWSELTTVAGNPVQPAPNDRWYADIPLNPTGPTTVTASLENGSLPATRQITWLPTNLLTTNTLTIRLGDSLKLSAFSGTEATPDETLTLTVEGQTTTIPADQPIVHTFTTAGTIPIQVTHSQNGNLTTATASINVVAAPVIESPVCVVGALREVKIPSLPSGVTLQLDLGLVIHSEVTDPDGSTRYTLRLPTLGSLPAITRIGINGPVLGSILFRMMRLRTTAQTGVIQTGQLDAATFDIQMPVIVDGIYAGTKIDFRIFIAGVTFGDGTIFKSLTMPNSVNEDGETMLYFYKTGFSGSNCHGIDIFQGSKKIVTY